MNERYNPYTHFPIGRGCFNYQKSDGYLLSNDVEVFHKDTEKEPEQFVMSGNEIAVTLTQEDSFKLDSSKKVEIQLRVLTTDNKALKSEIYVRDVTKCLNDEVL